MASYKGHHSSTPTPAPTGIRDGLHPPTSYLQRRRSATPNGQSSRSKAHNVQLMTSVEGDLGLEEDPKSSVFRDLYIKAEARLALLFEKLSKDSTKDFASLKEAKPINDAQDSRAETEQRPKKVARAIDEDDYDDSDGEGDGGFAHESPLKNKGSSLIASLPSTFASRQSFKVSANAFPTVSKAMYMQDGSKTIEEARKQLETDKKLTEDAARRSFHTLFYTFENDRDAMLEQNRLEESERQVEVELGHGSAGTNINCALRHAGQPGTLSQTNLGASSLTLKNLIKRIDDHRDKVPASDTELKQLISEVRKNRSKWASEDKVGQEELYEAAEKVLNELKAMTEHSGPFLTKVNKRDAPDYGILIKQPMDLGNMTKKLKNVQYNSKDAFVADLNLIWANCLKYNANPEHYLRRHALFMRKETEKLVPLIPNITIRDRADVEAEERRLHANLEGDEDSDDEPIMSSRGRKAPGKSSKKGTVSRQAPSGEVEVSPESEKRAQTNTSLPNGVGTHLKSEPIRADSETVNDGSQLSTPPPGNVTPAGVSSTLGHGAVGHTGEVPDVDNESMVNGMVPSIEGLGGVGENDDPEYKTWKQVTKKDRALVTAERHRLFKAEAIDGEAPALLRTKQGMRRWTRQQKEAFAEDASSDVRGAAETKAAKEDQPSGETLAEGMEGEEERLLPEYYDPLSAIPDIPHRLRWIEDSEGKVQDASDEFLRVMPKGLFVCPESQLTKRVDDNLRQIQRTQKLTSKIGVVKQMQLQSQMYQGQFQKHETIPFVERDVDTHVMLDDGPIIAPIVCRAALQRSIAKLLVHAGFDETQPSTLDAVTDMASDYFTRLARTLNTYSHAPQAPFQGSLPGEPDKIHWRPRFSAEEIVLHSLQENGADLDALDSYVTEDIERTGSKLTKTHDAMKAHLADLLRPALNDAGPDGVNAFNDDSEQFVGGDFAEELGEDFFGFKELGLDIEFGGSSMNVPLHLLKSRMYNASQAQNPSSTSTNLPSSLTPPAPFTPITVDTVGEQIGLVQEFFRSKLRANNDQPLIEDDDLPQKQRFPKPRLPPTGKITSPRKRPLKEPGPGKGHPKKKMKLNDGEVKELGVDLPRPGTGKEDEAQKEAAKGDPEKQTTPTHNISLINGIVPSQPSSPPSHSKDPGLHTGPTLTTEHQEKTVNAESGGMISPESLEATQ